MILQWPHSQSLLNSSKVVLPFLVSNVYLNIIIDLDENGRSHYLIRKSKNRKLFEIEDDEKEQMRKDIDNYRKS